jgi:TM2 domain-containing membrane protein YozV
MRKRSTAIFLALLFGSIGIHHIYLHNKIRAILYFTLSWTLMPLIASIIDALILMTLTDEQFHAFYNLSTLPSEQIDAPIHDIGLSRKKREENNIFDQAA